MKKSILALAVFLFLFRATAFCQAGSDAVNTAVSNLKTLLTDHTIEKAYLQFDRPYPCYVAGETVYFKAYVFMGEMHQPSTISNVLHVDLIDKNDVLMHSISLQLVNGTGWGDFTLPDSLAKGVYRVRAYTQWMRNDKNPYFFDQYLSVSSVSGVDQASDNTAQALKPDLQFFPEGGNLVADVPAKVAFKAIGTNGLGIDVKGVIVDNENKEIAKMQSVHLGMGGFIFIPEAGKTYKAMVTFANGAQESVDLPAVEAKGITLSVNTDDPSKVSIVIRANHNYFVENKNELLNLLVYYAGSLKRYEPKLESAELGLDLPANTFPTGILKVSLLSATGEPLNERLVFIQNPDLLNLSVTADKTAFAPRENVNLNLSAKNKDGSPVTGSFSVSVVDESKVFVDENAENSILSYLLLTTDIKGYVEKPNFYFTNVSKATRTYLDMLMLTQGYRRFDWKELESGNETAANAYSPEKGIDISGALKTKSGEPVADCSLTLFPESAGTPQTQSTDKDGKFTFANVGFWTGEKFVIKAQSSAGRKSILTLDKPAQEPLITVGIPLETKYNTNADILASLQNSQGQGLITASNGSTAMLVKNEKVAPVTKRYDDYRSSNLGGPGHADQVVLGNQLVNSSSLSIALKGLLHGVNFSGDVPYLQTGMTISGSSTGGSEGIEPMLVIVDGVSMGNGADIDIINPSSVEAVEVLKGPNAAIYGLQGGQGVLVITTNQGGGQEEVTGKIMSPGIFSVQPKGYYKAREFYSPKYDAQNAAGQPDHRTTIFWKPDVVTDAGGNASFNFFNSDAKGTYRVEVDGIDTKGNLGMQVFRYKVE